MKLFRIASVTVLLLGVMAYVGNMDASRPQSPSAKRGFTIHYKVTAKHGETVYMTGSEVRMVSETGAFKSTFTQIGLHGSVRTNTTIGDADGVYGFNQGRLELLSGANDPAVDEHYRSEDFIITALKPVRTEPFLGYECYVVRKGDSSGYAEHYYNPMFGSTYLKLARISPEGSWVKEALLIDLGEPDPELLKKPDRKPELNMIRDKISDAKAHGNQSGLLFLSPRATGTTKNKPGPRAASQQLESATLGVSPPEKSVWRRRAVFRRQ